MIVSAVWQPKSAYVSEGPFLRSKCVPFASEVAEGCKWKELNGLTEARKRVIIIAVAPYNYQSILQEMLMVRGTRQKQTRRFAGPRKPSSARRKSGSTRASSQPAARRLAVAARAKPRQQAPSQPPRKAAGVEHQTALKDFETAVRYFRKKDYERAVALFEKVAAGPVREIADRARVHLRFCESKRRQESRPKTAEGYYGRGVAALNNRDYDRALQYLTKSNAMIPNQEYVHYALAAAYGLRGDSDKAIDHLEKAIKLRPQNRVQALHDDDFQVLAGDPRLTRLLGADVHRPLI